MANTQRNFIAGIMNKSLDERLIPNGQYTDALNVRLGSTEETEIGSVENAKGNVALTSLEYEGIPLSGQAKCIGAFEDGANETIYWFVTDPDFKSQVTNKLDLIVSLNVLTNILTYHVISVNDGGNINTTLNFNEDYLINGVNLVDSKLLFFTDNFNPPRFINTERDYPNPQAAIDAFTAESILVIKKPPLNSPIVKTLPTSGQNNFLEDKFISFAYRYKYADSEYSATSQFSSPAFIPSPFQFSFAKGLNDGMLNLGNQAEITYNSGSELVVGIDLLFKDMNSGTIKVIEKLNKEDLGLFNNTEYSYTFSDQKIFTILPSSEILRLYDNVPLLSTAQTIMGNRLIYANYLEQRDIVTAGGFPTQLEYTTDLEANIIGLKDIDEELSSTDYTIDGLVQVPESQVTFIDVGDLELKAGASISIQIFFTHNQFSGNPADFPNVTTQSSEISFGFILPQDYSSVYELATSVSFIDAVGTITNIEPVVDACDGSTLTDEFNCIIPTQLSGLTKFESGISTAGQPIRIEASPGSNNIGLVLPAMRFVDDPTGAAITVSVYEYYEITAADFSFLEIGNPTSLHSDRTYEVGIIYMDDFNRATTALVSPNNTISVPCANSELQNKIQVTIPPEQIAPAWATRYKFCIKQDQEGGFNVFTTFFFTDPSSGADYFLLDGENSTKVEEGDILKVKSDATGPVNRCAFATVLEKKSQPRDFLNPAPLDLNGAEIPVPTGTYMKIRANEFSTDVGDNPVVNYGLISSSGSGCRQVNYPVDIEDSATPGTYVDYSLPAGSRVRIEILNQRRGIRRVPFKKWSVNQTFTVDQEYDSFKEWFDNSNIAGILEAQGSDEGTGVSAINYNPTLNGGFQGCSAGIISCQFITSGGRTFFAWKSSKGYSGNSRKKTTLEVTIEVLRSTSFIAFETPTQDALPDVWFESPVSYPIIQGDNKCLFQLQVDTNNAPIQFDYLDINNQSSSIIVQNDNNIVDVIAVCNSVTINPSTPPQFPADVTINSSPLTEGTHTGNIQNQTGTIPAIISTQFFNCYSFGNGVESYQARDSIKGKTLELGNRIFTTSAQDYQQVRRFADLTYSGVFNDESNVNKLNEFNLGLLNFKPIEENFGPIYKIDGRETDILTLQEDKISYVLQGKNLLSDSTGGGSIASIPEVLGTQISRIEEYGISFNPESYAKWGPNKFFTDAKRGAVIQLTGTSGQSERLTVISEAGMSSWFRDLFLGSFGTQKLGGYDPYMNEYVLSSTSELLPTTPVCIDCGITRTMIITSNSSSNFCVDVGNLVGDVSIDYNVIGVSPTFNIDAEYDNTTVTTGNTTVSGTLIVDKNSVAEDTVEVSIQSSGTTTLEVTVNCPAVTEITIIQVCYSLSADADKFIHNEYRWTDGAFISPLHSEQVELVAGTQNPLISQYTQLSGPQGGGFIPANTASVRIISNRILPIDDYVFDPSLDELRYLRSNTFYANTPNDMAALMAASVNGTPITGGPNTYQVEFPMPNTNEEYLYLIYDYRRPTEVELCYGNIDPFDVCCDCETGDNLKVQKCNLSTTDPVVEYIITAAGGLVIGDFVELSVGDDDCVYQVVQQTQDPLNAVVTTIRTDITDCSDVCQTYEVTNTSPDTAYDVTYVDCDDDSITISLGIGNTETICAKTISTLVGDVTLTLIDCDCTILPPTIVSEVRRCESSYESLTYPQIGYADTTGFNVTVGDLITITDGSNQQCVWEVLQEDVPQVATFNMLGASSFTDCSEVCQRYEIENSAVKEGGGDLTYTDCDGIVQTLFIDDETTIELCAREITNFTGSLADFNVTLIDCVCNQIYYEAELCQNSAVTTPPATIPELITVLDSAGNLSIGFFVFVNGCAYEIKSVVSGPETTTIDSFSSNFSCNSKCSEYIVTNTSSTLFRTIIYFDCVFQQQSQTIPPASSDIICLTGGQATLDPDMTLQYSGCECNTPLNFRIQQCRADDALVPLETISQGSTSAKVGDIVSILSNTDCRWEVIALTSLTPTQTINQVESESSCLDVCQEYEITNVSGSPILYEYTDCSGVTSFIPIANKASVTIAATDLTSATGVFKVLVNCQPSNLLIKKCSLQTVDETHIVPFGQNAQVGDFVSWSEDNCVFEVMNTTSDPLTGTGEVITNILTITDCTEVCQEYRVENPTNVSETITYVQCGGTTNTLTVGPQDIVVFPTCAEDIQPYDPALIITEVGDCDCNISPSPQLVTVQNCGGDVQPSFPVNDGGFTVFVGSFVTLQDGCIYEVVNTSGSGVAQDTITGISLVSNCIQVCQEYNLINNTQNTITFFYVDCIRPSQIDVPGFGSVAICATEVFADPNIIVELVDCECSNQIP
jgi:hypothetical protein